MFKKAGKGADGSSKRSLSRLAASFREGVMDLLFPPACIACGQRLSSAAGKLLLCSPCASGLDHPGLFCPRCGFNSMEHPRCRCGRSEKHLFFGLFWYEAEWKKVILKYKYGGQRQMSAPLGKLLGRFLLSLPFFPPSHGLVTYVPMHPQREKRRGYNQSFLLAREVAGVLDLPVGRLLTRNRLTAPQTSLRRYERRRNIRGSFNPVNGAEIAGKEVLVVDDVLTTGSTLEEISRLLYREGAKRVTGAVAGVQRYSPSI